MKFPIFLSLRTLVLVAFGAGLGGCYYYNPGPGPAHTYGLPPSPQSGTGDYDEPIAPNYGYDAGPSQSLGYGYYQGNPCYGGNAPSNVPHRSEHCPGGGEYNPESSGQYHMHWGIQF